MVTIFLWTFFFYSSLSHSYRIVKLMAGVPLTYLLAKSYDWVTIGGITEIRCSLKIRNNIPEPLQAWQQWRGAAVFQTDPKNQKNNVTDHLQLVRLARQVGAAGAHMVVVRMMKGLHVRAVALDSQVSVTVLLLIQVS